MVKYKYATTYGSRFHGYRSDRLHVPDDPMPPDDEDWEFVGGAVSDEYLYFFWRLEIKER